MLVDPSSPFTHGALLGDRIRLNSHYKDSNVFIRSLASRESKGGLSENISEISDILEFGGFDVILYETVGIGQVEIDVVQEVDTVVLVLVPESGDDIQMMKAGILEIADIYLINKFDREDSNRLYIALKNMLSIAKENNKILKWDIPIIKTIATKNKGLKDLYNNLIRHKNHIIDNIDIGKHKVRYENKVNKLINEFIKNKFWTNKKKNIFEKENTWLLCSDDQIVWVVGSRIDERFKLVEKTQKVYLAELNDVFGK